MQKKFFKKAMSAIIAFALVFSIVPAMGTASAADVGEITFEFNCRKINGVENSNALNATTALSRIEMENMTSYVELGSISDHASYYRKWSVFGTYIKGNGSPVDGGITAQHGLYYNLGSDGKIPSWFALKVKGLTSGTYNIKMQKDASTKKGCKWALYVLNASAYTTIDAINTAITDSTVTKVGTVDNYGSADTELEFGTITLSGNTDEYILVFRAEAAGVLNGNETESSTTRAYFAIKSLSFIPTVKAKNANIFGNTAAFFEKTNADSCDLYLVSAIDSLDYAGAGFEVSVDGGESEELSTDTVYKSISFTNSDGSTTTYTSDDLGLSGKYLYIAKKTLDSFSGQKINFRPFAVTVSDETVEGSAYEVTMKK